VSNRAAEPLGPFEDDWAEAHHDVEIVDDSGRVLTRSRLLDGLAGITTLHELVAEHLDPTLDQATTYAQATLLEFCDPTSPISHVVGTRRRPAALPRSAPGQSSAANLQN
jgi:hypothetical protein